MKENAYFTMEDYLKLHHNVLDYQAGMPGSADKIVQSFSDFIWKHVNFITGSSFSLEDSCLRRFISLYMSSSLSRKYAHQYKFKPTVKENLKDTGEMIQRLFSSYTPGEIRNELICTLLNMARKYKDLERPSFHNYVDKCFHYEAFRTLEYLISDPLMRLGTEEYLDVIADPSVEKDYTEALNEIEHSMSITSASCPVISDDSSPYDIESLNTNWINGVTCSDKFKFLTPFEREILVMSYVEKKTDSEIADKYGVCRATINRKKQAAIENLKRVNSDILKKE